MIKGLHFLVGGGTATLNITTTAARAFEDNKTAPYSMVVSSSADSLRSVTMVYVASKTSWFVTAGYKN